MATDQRVEVRPSPIEGLGLFAVRDLEAGEIVHNLEYAREVTAQHPLRTELGERHDHCAYPDGRVMLVAYPGRHMNHSCNPNAYYSYEDGLTCARARRTIEAGDEVTVDYLINTAGGDSWSCNCGSERCRGQTGTGFFQLPKEIQKEYLPLLAGWFRKRFARQISELEKVG